MSTDTLYARYIGLFDRGYGQEAIEIKLDYPFHGSGVITPPLFTLSIETGLHKNETHYIQVVCVAANSQQEAAKNLGTTQQNLSRYLMKHKEIQKRLGRGG